MGTRFDGDVVVAGSLIPVGGLTLPSGTVTNASVQAGADVSASKLEHQYTRTYSQEVGVDAATKGEIVHTVYGTSGTLLSFKAGAVTPAGAATTVTVDLKMNGTSVLSSPITLDNSQTAYQAVVGALSVTTLAANDVLSIHYALSGANEPQGVFATLTWTEKAA